MTTNSC